MVNATDLKSVAAKAACGFEPHARHLELFENRGTRAIGASVGGTDAGTIWVRVSLKAQAPWPET